MVEGRLRCMDLECSNNGLSQALLLTQPSFGGSRQRSIGATVGID